MSFKINGANGQIDITKGDAISFSVSYDTTSTTQFVVGDSITLAVYRSLTNPPIFTKTFNTVVDGAMTILITSEENTIPAYEGYYYKVTKLDTSENITTLIPDYPQQYARMNVYE